MAKKKTSKKRNDSKTVENVKSGIDFNNTLFLIAGIFLFLFAFYILTLYITNKNSDTEDNDSKTVEVSKEKILVGNILSMSDDEYLVLCYEFNGESADTYNNLYTTAVSTGKKIYKVDMSNAFNKKYKTDSESNKQPTKESDFLINGPTLIKVSHNGVAEYIEGEEAITNYLS